jgi:5-methylcytosine-specific restriction endonuclease McrA
MKVRLSWRRKPLRLVHRSSGVRAVPNRSRLQENIYEPITADTRLFVWQRDGGKCRNCGSRRALQFDHIIPRSLGGSNLAENVELLCTQCNLKKGVRLFAPRVNGF